MQTVFAVLSGTVSLFLLVLEVAMFLRALVSWFFPDGENRFCIFLIMITEPFIYPVRVLFNRFNWFQDSMLDVPYFVTYLFIAVLSMIL